MKRKKRRNRPKNKHLEHRQNEQKPGTKAGSLIIITCTYALHSVKQIYTKNPGLQRPGLELIFLRGSTIENPTKIDWNDQQNNNL